MSQNVQHTPGPWRTGKTDKFAADEVVSLSGKRVAQCSARWQSTPETEANAHLIAEAPKMLAVLKRVASAWGPDGNAEACIEAEREVLAVIAEVELAA